MVRQFLGMLLLVFPFWLDAQSIDIKTLKSNVFTDEFKESEIVLAEEDGTGGILIVRSYEGGTFSKGKGYYIEQYDADLKLIRNKEFPLEHDNAEKNAMIVGIFTMNGALQLLDLFYDLNQKAYICRANSISLSDLTQQSKELFRHTREEMESYGDLALRDLFFSPAFKFWRVNMYSGAFLYPISAGGFFSNLDPIDGGYVSSGISVAVAEDKKSFAMALDLSGKQEALKAYLFDDQLTKKFEQYYSPEIKDRKYHYQSLQIGPDGQSVFLLGKAYTENAKKKEEGGKYEYLITRFDAAGQQSAGFDTGTHFITSLKTIVNNGKIACIGFYSDRKDQRYKGVSYFDVDPLTLALGNVNYSPFSEQFLIDKYGKNKQKELKFLTFRKLLVTDNHDIIFNAEEAFSSTSGGTMMGGGGLMMGGNTTTYVFEDIVSAKINDKGELQWARNINKTQWTYDDQNPYQSYTSVINGDENYFFINTADDVKKISGDRIEFQDVLRNKSNLVAIRVKADGSFSYEQVLDNEQNEVPFMVSRGIVSGKSVYFLGRKGKKKQLLKLMLP